MTEGDGGRSGGEHAGRPRRSRTRRRFLAAASVAGATGLAGCGGLFGGNDGGGGTPTGNGNVTSAGQVSFEDFRGSGANVGSRGEISGARIEELPDLSGSLTIYLGGGEGGLYTNLLSLFKGIYPDFDPQVRLEPGAQLANKIIEEQSAGSSVADVFWSVDAGSLAAVAAEGGLASLSSGVVEPVPSAFHPDDAWVGVAGRARAVPYNTNKLSASDIPNKVRKFPDTGALQGSMGWAPTYSAFQAFVTAMRELRGDQKTKQWLRRMMEAGTTEYPDEFVTSNAVADGELAAGFANHYYALRVKAARPKAPLDLAFTSGDAGALINASGAGLVKGTEKTDLAENFVRHLLSAEAQEFFATRTFAYPMIPGVPPVGGLPRIDELNPPSLDLTALGDVEGTIRLMREVGVL